MVRARLALLAIIAAVCCAPGARADESISEVVQLKLRGVQEILDHDWLTDLVRLSETEGGLAQGLMQLRFMAAAVRGHTEEALLGENGAAMRDALVSGAAAEAFGRALRDALAAPEGSWVRLKEGFGSRAHLQAALRRVPSLELREEDDDEEAAVRVRAGGREEVERVDAAFGTLRGYLWPLRRAQAVWRAVAVCEDPYMMRVPLEATVWLVADGLLWVLHCGLPWAGRTVGALDGLAQGQSGSFRGMLVALCALLFVYCGVSTFVDIIFFTGGVVQRSWRMAVRKLSGKKKTS